MSRTITYEPQTYTYTVEIDIDRGRRSPLRDRRLAAAIHAALTATTTADIEGAECFDAAVIGIRVYTKAVQS